MSEPGRPIPLLIPRRLAIRLLHEAQVAPAGFAGVVGAGAEPDCYLPLGVAGGLDAAVAQLEQRHSAPWAVYLYRPEAPTAPTPADFAEAPELLRLTASLKTKGVLQLRAWMLRDGRVVEREIDVRD